MKLIFKTNANSGENSDENSDENYFGGVKLKHLYFNDPVQNSIIHDSYFVSVFYSDNDISLTGLMLPIKLSFITISKSFNKNIIIYDFNSNKEIISNISQLETLILEKYNNVSNSSNKPLKQPVYSLTNQLKSGSIKLFSDIDKRKQECNIILKISGVWENVKEYGVTFKFIDS